MPLFPFPHDARVYIVADDYYEVAYYSRGNRKYKRIRRLGQQTWQQTGEQQIDHDHFWMVAACIERGKVVRNGMV